MPTIYLSPSTQQSNIFYGGGSEEYYMNLIADAMIPYLQRYGINYTRNTPDMTAGSSIRQSNAGNYDFHVAIHSNASPEATAGKNRGTIIFYYPSSSSGKRMADILVNNFKKISQTPNLVTAVPTTSLGEVSRTVAPSVLIEVAYHDNPQDAAWIKNNIDSIANTIATSINQYFTTSSQPSGRTGNEQYARVTLNSGYLNIRNGPAITGEVIGMVENGATVLVTEKVRDWYRINYNGLDGYVFGQYLRLL